MSRAFTNVRTSAPALKVICGRFRPDGSNTPVLSPVGEGWTATRTGTGVYTIVTTEQCEAIISSAFQLVSASDEGTLRKDSVGSVNSSTKLATVACTYLAPDGSGGIAPASLAAHANTWIEFMLVVSDAGQV